MVADESNGSGQFAKKAIKSLVDSFFDPDDGILALHSFMKQGSEFLRNFSAGSSKSTVETMAAIGFHAVLEELESRDK